MYGWRGGEKEGGFVVLCMGGEGVRRKGGLLFCVWVERGDRAGCFCKFFALCMGEEGLGVGVCVYYVSMELL